jgi:alpha-beta hydrolase superfamily lysophospholipase
MSTQIVFIHGAFVGPSCWELFRERAESRGFSTEAPAWPHDDRPVSELRAAPDDALASIGVGEIVEHYAQHIAEYETPPLLIGHSFGGLFVQLLLDRGLGRAGVAIHPAPPRGVLPGWAAIVSNASVLSTPGGWKKLVEMPLEHFGNRFANGLDDDQKEAAWQRHVIPTPGRPFFQAAFAPFVDVMRVNYENADRGPLLITAGGNDRTVTAGMNRANFRKYGKSSAETDFRLYDGRSHFTIAEPGWEQVADDALDWLAAHAA